MTFDFFLWPMILPMILPLFYSLKYKRNALSEILAILFIMTIIIIVYWPLSLGIPSAGNIVVKFLLFVLFPLVLLFAIQREKTSFLKHFGIQRKGIKKSLQWGLLLLPIMLLVTFAISYFSITSTQGDLFTGGILFIEAFTEEFFFRGVLFLALVSRTNVKIAYLTSLASFVLMHPQHFTSFFIIGTIVQGVLTLEITRRSENLFGAWILHGTNRFFSIVVLPFLTII
jgi:membrane protease YdiL (CAAX protease family)